MATDQAEVSTAAPSKKMEGRLLACGGALGVSRAFFREGDEELENATSMFVRLLTLGFKHWSPVCIAAACRSVGLAVTSSDCSSCSDVAEGQGADLPQLVTLATRELTAAVAHKTPEVKESALYAMKQLGRVLPDATVMSVSNTMMPPVLALLRSNNARMKGPCERAARHVLLGRKVADVDSGEDSAAGVLAGIERGG